ncbi:hypothetical protein [Micromonospora arborensis]|uniref:hypothetical protein n=1 Tax=Micromonospora arborensis TaxID=2116518 RepID=UPI00372242C3
MHTNLPTHPRNGLTALGFRKPRAGEDGPQPIWPAMGGSQPTGEPTPTAAPPAPAPAAVPPATTPPPAPIPTPAQVFPPAAQPTAPAQQDDAAAKAGSTPWRELPLEDQVAYWQAQSRKHEGRQLAALGLRPGELDELRAQATANQQTYQGELTAAEQRGRTAAQAEFGLQLADTHIRMAVRDRMTDEQVNGLLGHLNLGQFLTTDHKVDADKVSQFVALLPAPAAAPPQDPANPAAAPATGTPTATPVTGAGQRVDMGQGKPSSAKPSGLEAGRLLAQQRFGTAKQTAP